MSLNNVTNKKNHAAPGRTLVFEVLLLNGGGAYDKSAAHRVNPDSRRESIFI